MSPPSDHVDEMPGRLLSDEAIEAFFVGTPHPGWEGHEALTLLMTDVNLAVAEAPAPDHALVRLFWGADSSAAPARDLTVERRPRRLPRRRRLVASALAGGALALAGFGAAGAAGSLPDAAQRVVAHIVDAVSPLRLPQPPDPAPGPSAQDRGRPGEGPVVLPGATEPSLTPHAPSPRGSGADPLPSPTAPGSARPGADLPIQPPSRPPAGEATAPTGIAPGGGDPGENNSGAGRGAPAGREGPTPSSTAGRSGQKLAATTAPPAAPRQPAGSPPTGPGSGRQQRPGG